jgi:hypothetical protein
MSPEETFTSIENALRNAEAASEHEADFRDLREIYKSLMNVSRGSDGCQARTEVSTLIETMDRIIRSR